jgi:protein kinase A
MTPAIPTEGSDEQSGEEEDEVRIVDNYRGVVKSNFVFHYVIGKGGFGKVWKVELKKNRVPYAMKEMSKAK